MTFNDAKKLHNGDEVLLKETGESINVLSAQVFDAKSKVPKGQRRLVRNSVVIEGVGRGLGYGHWTHDQVR